MALFLQLDLQQQAGPIALVAGPCAAQLEEGAEWLLQRAAEVEATAAQWMWGEAGLPLADLQVAASPLSVRWQLLLPPPPPHTHSLHSHHRAPNPQTHAAAHCDCAPVARKARGRV